MNRIQVTFMRVLFIGIKIISNQIQFSSNPSNSNYIGQDQILV